MPKRKLNEEEEEDNSWVNAAGGSAKIVDPEKIKKHSLDSDEEESDEDEQKYHILASDDITGQEEATAQFDGEVQITPFNMKEELEEGHFDTEGHYHFKKESREERDVWLDNIDWIKVRRTAPEEGVLKEAESSSDDEEVKQFDKVGGYRSILSHLKPGESVAKALRRLGGGQSLTASQKLKMKKLGQSVESSSEDKADFLTLTELANNMLNATGNMNVYQETFEQIQCTVNIADARKAKVEDPLDLFADNFDEKEKERIGGTSGEAEKPTESEQEKESSSQDQAGKNDVVQWEFKWSESSDEVHGPHTSEQMQAWVEEGYFKDSVCVRKVGSAANFYSARRVDFELYI
ncbi:CD2 antigen cytoplasmic tail-binding protein 2 homolog [Neocloeon triangulifer]|uniref:CD2 antigen cytoplasmic tail-binding protein 2 homolog n=1 Tax=Neocloeon triangulifer TaxID=2078957 RepID=UPI00286F3576|nr:CD2 antigen cytoplasmic tail-binding protein 2 homolog [Neocloeon triangulifer]